MKIMQRYSYIKWCRQAKPFAPRFDVNLQMQNAMLYNTTDTQALNKFIQNATTCDWKSTKRKMLWNETSTPRHFFIGKYWCWVRACKDFLYTNPSVDVDRTLVNYRRAGLAPADTTTNTNKIDCLILYKISADECVANYRLFAINNEPRHPEQSIGILFLSSLHIIYTNPSVDDYTANYRIFAINNVPCHPERSA